MYDAAITDMELLEREMLSIGSFYIGKFEEDVSMISFSAEEVSFLLYLWFFDTIFYTRYLILYCNCSVT